MRRGRFGDVEGLVEIVDTESEALDDIERALLRERDAGFCGLEGALSGERPLCSSFLANSSSATPFLHSVNQSIL